MPTGKQVCSMIASVISIRVVDTGGHPVPNATVRITRLRNGKFLGDAQEMGGGSGEFAIVESSAISWVGPHGERIRVAARAGSKAAVGVVRVGRDPTGCRLAKVGGPDVLTLK